MIDKLIEQDERLRKANQEKMEQWAIEEENLRLQ